jgi:hypothetical protein
MMRLRACAPSWLAERPEPVRKPVLAGAIFGVVVFLSMRFAVLPLAAGLDLLSHMFLSGTPIALAAAKAITHKGVP